MSADDLELFVCERFKKMGYQVARLGSARTPDGGIDLVVCPPDSRPFPYLMAVQVKSHARTQRRTPLRDVRDFVGALSGQPFHGGVLITNTTFTFGARWFAKERSHIVHLRDFKDLCRWVYDDFAAHEHWREIPATLSLGPGLTVPVHDLLRDRK